MIDLLLTAVLVVWVAFLGGVIGSFLNVVVHRVPAGLSVVHPPSRCPKCEHAIRWYDNVPVLGWLWLRGKCRDCGNPISARYPLVEAITAGMFVAVVWSAGLFKMAPFLLVLHAADDRWLEAARIASQVGINLLLICTVWTAALMEVDGDRIPLRLQWPAAAILLVANPLVLNGLSSLHGDSLAYFDSRAMLDLAISQIVAALAVAVWAMITTVFWTLRGDDAACGRWPFVELAAMSGLVLGLDMVAVLAIAVLLGVITSLVRSRYALPLLMLWLALVAHTTLGDHYQRMVSKLRYELHVGFVVEPWYMLAGLALLVIVMTEACLLIRRRSLAATPRSDSR